MKQHCSITCTCSFKFYVCVSIGGKVRTRESIVIPYLIAEIEVEPHKHHESYLQLKAEQLSKAEKCDEWGPSRAFKCYIWLLVFYAICNLYFYYLFLYGDNHTLKYMVHFISFWFILNLQFTTNCQYYFVSKWKREILIDDT